MCWGIFCFLENTPKGVTQMSNKTSVLLAIAEENMSQILKKALVQAEHDFDVLYDEVMHRRYLLEMVNTYKPKIVIIHDKFLPGDKITAEERNEEMIGIIRQIRMKHEQEVRIVYVCIRDRNDPFLGKIIGLGVYDIFYMGQFSTGDFAKQLSEPPKFSNVMKFSNGNFDVERIIEQEKLPSENTSVTDSSEEEVEIAKENIVNRVGKALKRKKVEPDAPIEMLEIEDLQEDEQRDKGEEVAVEDSVEEVIVEEDLQPEEVVEETQSKIKDVITFGTVVIAVGGLNPNTGVTSTAVAIAKHLQSISKSVALVELNYSLGFDRIHAFYENAPELLIGEDEFECDKLHHYKHRIGMKLPEILNSYDYVVMDMGLLSDSHPYINEFKRATLRLVITPQSNWKWFTVDALIKQDSFALSNYTFLLPTENTDIISEFKKDFGLTNVASFQIPNQLYELSSKESEQIDELLNHHIHSQMNSKKSSSKGMLLAGAAIALCAVGTFYFLL